MAAFVQTLAGGSGTATGTATTSSATTTTGNLMVVCAGAGSNTLNRLTSVTDSFSNAYTRAVSINSSSTDMEVWYCINFNGGALHTVTATSSNAFDNVSVLAQEFSGTIVGTTALDALVSASASTALMRTKNTSRLLAPTEVAVCCAMIETNTNTPTVGGGYSNFVAGDAALAGQKLYMESLITPNVASIYGEMFDSAANTFHLALVTFIASPLQSASLKVNPMRPHAFSPGLAR